MKGLDELIAGGEEFAQYALLNGIPLSAEVQHALVSARSTLAGPIVSEPERAEFLKALSIASQAVGVTVAEIRSTKIRLERLRPQVASAMRLLSFAAANGKKVDDKVRTSLTAIANALEGGTATAAHEDEFLKSYEELCLQTAPVTAESLAASDTRLPDFSNFSWFKRFGQFTLGRYVNVLIFILVLVLAGVTLAYYAQGANAVARYDELKLKLEKLQIDAPAKLALMGSLKLELERLGTAGAKPDAAALAAATKSLQDAELQANVAETTYAQVARELDNIPARLETWADLPCDANFVVKAALCSSADRRRTVDSNMGTGLSQVEAGRAVATRLSGIYLPMLLGWLGAHAFILRKMTREIQEHTFAKDSSLHHIARSGLGALAGLASTWLLTPEVVGGAQLKSVPTWALAFVAGYGIELVFEFMDRIIAAFTKPA